MITLCSRLLSSSLGSVFQSSSLSSTTSPRCFIETEDFPNYKVLFSVIVSPSSLDLPLLHLQLHRVGVLKTSSKVIVVAETDVLRLGGVGEGGRGEIELVVKVVDSIEEPRVSDFSTCTSSEPHSE